MSRIVEIPPRQIQNLSDKGAVIAFKEATGGGSNRGYDSVNGIELLLCKKLSNNGMGIQYIKTILNSLRENNLLRQWIENPSVYFTRLQGKLVEIIRPRLDHIPGMSVDILEELEESFFYMFLGDPTKIYKEQRATLIHFFPIDTETELQKGFSVILPGVELETTQLTMKACSYLYMILTLYPGAVIVNIGDIRKAFYKAMIDNQGAQKNV